MYKNKLLLIGITVCVDLQDLFATKLECMPVIGQRPKLLGRFI